MRRQRVMTFDVPGDVRWLFAALALCCFCLGFSRPASGQTSTFTVNAGTSVSSPGPIAQTGGTDYAGGQASAGSTLKAEAHAYATAPNTLTSTFASYGASARGQYGDIIITGPTPTVTVTIRLQFHANYSYSYAGMSDGSVSFTSFTAQTASFTAYFGAAHQVFDVTVNRALDLVNFNPPPTEPTWVATPRDPTLPGVDANGFLRQYFRLVTPITSAPGYGAYAGFQVDEIDELRGEIRLTATVPVGTPVVLDLSLDINSGAASFYIVGAGGSLDARNTFGVPQDGTPVFDLPSGYSVNAPSLGIVDNVVPVVGDGGGGDGGGGGGGGGGGALPCPLPHGDWKNTSGPWPVTSLVLGSKTYSQAELLQILRTPVGSGPGADASVILAYQLIAAKLNIANGSDPVPISAVVADADNLLSAFAGKLTYKVKPSSVTGKLMTAAAATLEKYNTQQLTLGCVLR